MRKIAMVALAAIMATVGVTMDAGAESRGGHDGRSDWADSSVYSNYGYRQHRHWRRHAWRHNRWGGPRVVVRRDYGSCYKRRYDSWGNVRIKLRRACRW